jgi:hypothetical protein
VKYALKIPANDSLERDIAELLPRTVVGSSRNHWWSTRDFHQAAGWKAAWPVTAKVASQSGGLHCNQPESAEPGCGALRQQARNLGAWIKERSRR